MNLKLKEESFEWMPYINKEQFERLLNSDTISVFDRSQFEVEKDCISLRAGFNTLLRSGDIVINTKQGWKKVPYNIVGILFDMTEYQSNDLPDAIIQDSDDTH